MAFFDLLKIKLQKKYSFTKEVNRRVKITNLEFRK